MPVVRRSGVPQRSLLLSRSHLDPRRRSSTETWYYSLRCLLYTILFNSFRRQYGSFPYGYNKVLNFSSCSFLSLPETFRPVLNLSFTPILERSTLRVSPVSDLRSCVSEYNTSGVPLSSVPPQMLVCKPILLLWSVLPNLKCVTHRTKVETNMIF